MFEGTDTEARLWEIAENLHRADLTVQERADHIAEWVKLTEVKQAEKVSAQVGPKLPKIGVGQGVGGGRPESGINAASRELNITRQEAQRAVKIASITPEARGGRGRPEHATRSARNREGRTGTPGAAGARNGRAVGEPERDLILNKS